MDLDPTTTPIENETSETLPAAQKPRRPWLIAGLILLVVAVGAAAFIGGRLLNNQPAGDGNAPMILSSGPGVSIAQSSFKLDMTPAEELPKTPSDVNGLFVKRADNVVTIGTGQSSMVVSVSGSDAGTTGDSSTGPIIQPEYSGPEIEVVITKDTRLYRDVTFDDMDSPLEGEQTIQQKVQAGTIDDLTSQSHLVVWGRKVGERYIADVVLFTGPVIFHKSK